MSVSNSVYTTLSNCVHVLSSFIFDCIEKNLILSCLVILDNATYRCPCVNAGNVVSNSILLYC